MRAILGPAGVRRVTALVVVALLALAALLALGLLAGGATAQPPASVDGAKRFDDLRELNNKLDRAITTLKKAKLGGINPDQLGRTLKDLEVTKLRAVDQFPNVFGLPFPETFVPLSCVDEKIAVGQELLRLLHKNYLGGPGLVNSLLKGKLTLHFEVKRLLREAKDCKDTLEVDLSGVPSVPAGVSDDLRELNNKLSREISKLKQAKLGGVDPDQIRRALTDLEVTKLRAVDQFPEILDPPYGDIFRQLSCIDEKIAVGQELLRLLHKNYLGGPGLVNSLLKGKLTLHFEVKRLLQDAKSCKDVLEVDLLHSFNLKPSEQTEVSVNATTPNGTDTQNPNKLNAPKTLEHAYAHDGFVGRHEQDYVATGVSSSSPDSWPSGRNVLFFDVFDLFGSTRGAQKAAKASEQNLRTSGFTPIADSSLGSGEAAFQKQAAGSPLLSTIIYVQRGTFIMKIAGACNGCSKGSIESSLQSVARAQIAQATTNGFPPSSTQPHSIPEEFDYSGSGGVFGEPGRKACIYLSGPIGQTGDVKLEPGDATARTDPNAQTYDQPFTLDSNGKAFLTFTEPNELFKVTINRKELDGSTNTTTTSMTPQIHHPPPWGLPDCTQ